MKRSLHRDRDHPNIAVTLHALGEVSQAAGDLPEAKQHLEESLRMKRSLHGDRDHPGIAATLHALCGVSLKLLEILQKQSSIWRRCPPALIKMIAARLRNGFLN